MQPISSAAHARAAIAEALFNKPRTVLVDGRSERQFVEIVFPGLRDDTPLYVCPDETVTSNADTTPGARAPAFDVFQQFVNPNYPLLGIFVTKGVGSIESMSLDDQLFAYYSTAYDDAPGALAQPYRLLNGLSFLEPTTVVDTAEIAPGLGVVIPQVAGAAPMVYRLNPRFGADNLRGPHAFIKFTKFVVPRQDARTVATLAGLGFVRWTRR